MHHRIIRFVSTDSGRIALVALSIILVLLGGLGLCKAVLDEMLRKNAEATSSSWVETMVARNPEILKLPSGVPLSDRTRQVLDDASQFGDIYRFRIWDKAGRPDIDSFEAVMMREDRLKGFFVSFDYTSDATTEIGSFFRRTGKVIIPLTVREILEEEIAMKLA